MNRSDAVAGYLKNLDLPAPEQNIEYIRDVVTRHLSTYAFGNIGCLLGNELRLDFDSLYDRICVQRRGGYCFEQNGLLFDVLKDLGFSPRLGLARVIYNQDTHPGLTHRISFIENEGQTYVLDVGFGPLVPRVPVPLSGIKVRDGDKTFRIAERKPGEHHMQVLKEGEFFSLYRFELASYGQSDCEVGHFYSHRHPDAIFVNHLVVSLSRQTEIRSLRNLDYWVISPSDTRSERITAAERLQEILVDQLGLHVCEKESQQLFEKAAIHD